MFQGASTRSYAESHFNDNESGHSRRSSSMDQSLFTLSHQVLHGGGGTSLIRRKLFEGRRLTKDGAVNMTLMRDSYQDLELGGIAGPSSSIIGPENFISAATMSNQILDELTYKDLYNLKELSFPMSKKKELRAKIIADQGKVGGKSEWSSSTNVKWRRFKESSSDALHELKLWSSSMREIEGRFGHGIGSYFSFLRWLFVVNVATFLLLLVFIVVPTVVFESLGNSTFIATTDPIMNVLGLWYEVAVTIFYVTVSAECAYSPYDPRSINTFPQYLIWWFTGQGFMENTVLFYGYYSNALTSAQSVSFNYDMPLAYLLVAFFYLFLNLVLVVNRAATGLKGSTSTSDELNAYVSKVFCGWDYCVTDQKAADLKHGNLKYQILAAIEEERNKEKKKNRTGKEKAILYSKRVAVNLITVIFLGGALVAIFFAAQYSLQYSSTDDSFFVDLLITYLTSLVITVLNFIAPLLFEALVILEDYTPEFTIRITLIRTVTLRLASVVFLYVAVYVQTKCSTDNLDAYNPVCNVCFGVECWETHLGQEMYKLTLLNFFIVIALTFLVEFPRKLIVTHFECCGLSEWLGQQEFSLPTNVLDLVYIQTVGWIGSFYAPLLPVMVIIEFFIFFYLKKLTLLYNCRPGSKAYQASKTGTFFYLILIVGFVVAAFPVVVGVGIMKPSQDCGPFRQLPTMFFVVTESIMNLPIWTQELFWFCGSAWFSILLILLLSLVLHYYFTLVTANQKLISLLKNQLTLEGKDKQFLLSRVNQWTAKLEAGGGRGKKLEQAHKAKGGRVSLGGRINASYVPDSVYYFATDGSSQHSSS